MISVRRCTVTDLSIVDSWFRYYGDGVPSRDDVPVFSSFVVCFDAVGDVTFESAAYVARYITKKVTGPSAEAHYGVRCPEYVTMSRRPGIGRGWFDKFAGDVYPSDEVLLFGRERMIRCKPPKYYDSVYELDSPEDFRMVKSSRRCGALEVADNCTPERLLVREKCQVAKFNQLKRGYENGS